MYIRKVAKRAAWHRHRLNYFETRNVIVRYAGLGQRYARINENAGRQRAFRKPLCVFNGIVLLRKIKPVWRITTAAFRLFRVIVDAGVKSKIATVFVASVDIKKESSSFLFFGNGLIGAYKRIYDGRSAFIRIGSVSPEIPYERRFFRVL